MRMQARIPAGVTGQEAGSLKAETVRSEIPAGNSIDLAAEMKGV